MVSRGLHPSMRWRQAIGVLGFGLLSTLIGAGIALLAEAFLPRGTTSREIILVGPIVAIASALVLASVAGLTLGRRAPWWEQMLWGAAGGLLVGFGIVVGYAELAERLFPDQIGQRIAERAWAIVWDVAADALVVGALSGALGWNLRTTDDEESPA